MRLAQAGHLFAQGDVGRGDRIAGRREARAVVERVDDGERILVRESLIEARGAEILADVLQGIGEDFGDMSRAFPARRDSRVPESWRW